MSYGCAIRGASLRRAGLRPTAEHVVCPLGAGVGRGDAARAGGAAPAFALARPVIAGLSVPRTASAGARRAWRSDRRAGRGEGGRAGDAPRPSTHRPALAVSSAGSHGPHDCGALAAERDADGGGISLDRQRSRPPRRYAAKGAHSSGVATLTGDRACRAGRPRPQRSKPRPPRRRRRANRACRRPRRPPPTARSSRSRGRTTSAVPKTCSQAPRDGYRHQGQDILTAEGTPVLAPLRDRS